MTQRGISSHYAKYIYIIHALAARAFIEASTIYIPARNVRRDPFIARGRNAREGTFESAKLAAPYSVPRASELTIRHDENTIRRDTIFVVVNIARRATRNGKSSPMRRSPHRFRSLTARARDRWIELHDRRVSQHRCSSRYYSHTATSASATHSGGEQVKMSPSTYIYIIVMNRVAFRFFRSRVPTAVVSQNVGISLSLSLSLHARFERPTFLAPPLATRRINVCWKIIPFSSLTARLYLRSNARETTGLILRLL